MINRGADRAHYFPQDRSSSMAAVQISPNDEKYTASAHLEYLRRGGVTTETARAASMPNTTAPKIGPCRPQCRDRHHLGSLGCPMTQSNTSEIEPTVDIIFALKAGMAAPVTRGNNGPIGEPTREAFATTCAGTP
jgi:hypothetical protein